MDIDFTRREALAIGGSAAVAGTAASRPQAPPVSSPPVGPGPLPVRLRINGEVRRARLEPRVTLLDALREHLGLTGTKKGCDRGECGACTVLVGGRRVKACLTFAVMHQDAEITTIEGLSDGDRLHPLQEAFIRHDAFQCGFCTPGQIVSAAGLIAERRPRGDAEIRERMSGNLCRCSAYPNIVAAVRDVAERR